MVRMNSAARVLAVEAGGAVKLLRWKSVVICQFPRFGEFLICLHKPLILQLSCSLQRASRLVKPNNPLRRTLDPRISRPVIGSKRKLPSFLPYYIHSGKN
ncbi:uncharacterized protein PGTG_13289 [Puccinia graminis f. sp. tritici CRL 75-36-700-3]|uniref:Uncharacterized protein n=1 Tax=Puccinia graminis f. sp. tritici (strain CRL 75-36-700-3 / race SCCL) TaxID=418459 RepID=E3KRZ5_PUCGT|nr:uncharacterized protein PGTG_13289 [Puccinia graminis f. sp. tritici CRL 75-36-700-3]EFP87070.1 hypothetical protein PGTG_13289 [Puccinia graminis f. sp. tritici CRL 75-36-700-3]